MLFNFIGDPAKVSKFSESPSPAGLPEGTAAAY